MPSSLWSYLFDVQRIPAAAAAKDSPVNFSEYTIGFANLFAHWWDCSKDWGKDFLDGVPL
jgi:hypothetical protein